MEASRRRGAHVPAGWNPKAPLEHLELPLWVCGGAFQGWAHRDKAELGLMYLNWPCCP